MKTIVCVSDLQIPYHDKRAVANLAAFIKAYKPTEVVSVGDEMDMQTISKWAKGTPLEYERSIGRDRDETTRVLEALKVKHIIRSNHTDRLFNTVMMRSPGLLGLPELELPEFLRLDSIGTTYHEKPYELAPNWLLMHGDEGSMNSTGGLTALGLAKRTGKSVVCGHTHRMGLAHHTTSYTGSTPKTVWGMEVGNLMDYKKAKYIKGGLFTWQQGFGILYVDGKTVIPSTIPIARDGSFIVEGKVWGR
jgi:predicted phosphodiesterase